MIYQKFKIDGLVYKGLNKNERELIRLLDDAIKDLAKVYEQQLKDGFYPKGVTKKQIEEASKKNSALLSPFTYVERSTDGKLVAIPYHKKYADLLQPVVKKIQKAASVAQNKSLMKYLKARAKSLLDGSYKEADVEWFNVKNSKINFSIGPFERYLDNILFIKRAYQAHIGVVDAPKTVVANRIKEALYASAKMSYDRHHSAEIPKKGVNVSVEYTPSVAGYMADILFIGEHFPSDLDVMQRHGSIIIIYRSPLELKFKKIHYPIFKAIFEKRFAFKYSQKLLFRALGWNVLLYECSRQLHKFPGARERLKELYGYIDELNGSVSGIQHSKQLLVKGLISQEELEAMIIVHIVRIFANWFLYRTPDKGTQDVFGNVMALNLYLEKGALSEKEGIYWPNFAKMFFEIENLADYLVYLLREGSYKEAEKFIKTNSQIQSFEKLARNIEKLSLKI